VTNRQQEIERFIKILEDINLWFIPVVKNQKRPLIKTKSTKDPENRLNTQQTIDMITDGGNVGIFGLQDGLMIVDLDCDSHWVNFFPPTLTAETWSGRHHLYYKNDGTGNSSFVVKKFSPEEKKEGHKDHEIEFRGQFHYVLTPGSHIEENGKKGDYKIIKYTKPTSLPSRFIKILNKEKVVNLFNGEWQQYDFPSRSEAELSLITHLMENGFENKEIKRILHANLIGKTSEKRTDAYLDRSIEKAKKFLVAQDLEALEEKTEKKIDEPDEIPLNVVWGPDLLKKEFDDMKWYVDGYIPEKGVVMWAGKRASAKTWLALACAVSMATRMPFLDKFETDVDENISILYIDEENGEHTIQNRLLQIMKGMGIENGLTNLGVVSYSGLRLDNYARRKGIETFLKKHNPCIIFVDSLKRVLGADENNATEMNNVFTEIIRPISEKYDVTWILQHHLRKGVAGNKPDDLMDELRGSSEIVNYADVVLIFDRVKGVQNRFIFHQAKCRRAAEQPSCLIELNWNEKNNLVMFDNLGAPEETLDAVELCGKAILIWGEENNILEFTTSEIKNTMLRQGHNKKSITRALTTLIEQGKLARVKRGVYYIPGSSIKASDKSSDEVEDDNKKSTKDSEGTKGQSIYNFVPNVPNSKSSLATKGQKGQDPNVPKSLSQETAIKELIDFIKTKIEKEGPLESDKLFTLLSSNIPNFDESLFEKVIEYLKTRGLIYEQKPGILEAVM